jgi:DNA-binding transcriptional ArsR family regulator
MDIKLREEITQLHAQICSGLADSNRILLLYALSEQPHTVGNLAEILAVPQPTVSRHLKVLRERGLVTAAREGQTVCYHLADERVIQALDLLRAVLGQHLENRASLARSVAQKIELP